MKKTIGTITFHSSYNHGSMLQAYALQEYITKKFGKFFDYKIINLRTKRQRDYYNRPFCCYDLKNIIKSILFIKYRRMFLDGRKNYENFLNNRLNITEEYSTINELCDANLSFDYYISGSDQIWNYPILDFDWSFFLEFCEKGKKISYAASLGPNKIDDCDESTKKRITKDLSEYSKISVREKGSYDAIKKITGREDISINIDPTLLLDEDDWKKIIDEKRLIEDDYIFLYDLKNNSESYKIADRISKKYKMPVVTVKNMYHLKNEYKHFIRKYDAGPSEFLNYVKNAKIVISSSFHGNVFSIILKKPFLAVGGSRDNRIKDILEITGLKDRAVGNVGEIPSGDKLFNVDFSKCDAGLVRERQKTERYFCEALEVGDKK